MSYRGRSQSRGYSGRGRSQSNRGSSRPDRPQRRRSYEEIVEDSKQQTVKKKQEIAEVKAAPVKPVEEQKKESLVQKGQQWFNKFFAGMKRKERGNMKIEFNDDLDLQLMDPYNYRLTNLAFTKNYYSADDVQRCGDYFRILINLMIGLKLLKANTNSNKVMMKEFMPLANLEIKVPKNLMAIINSIGKTDVGSDNIVRIVGQNSIIKQAFFKAVMLNAWLSEAKFFNNMKFKDKITWALVQEYCQQNLMKYSEKKVYTRDIAGLDIIHSYGKQAIDNINKTDINVGTEDDKIFCRVPYLDPKDMKDIQKLSAWEQKVRKFFTKLSFDGSKYYKALGYAFLGWFPLKFIVNGDKTFKELDDTFKNSIFADIKPDDILKDNGWHDLNKWMDDEMLFYNVVTIFDYYKSNMEMIYDDMLNMTKFEPTEFGNGSQTVMVKSWSSGYLNFPLHSFKLDMAETSIPSNAYSKITDEEAVIGSVFSFNTGVELDSSYNIHTVGTAKEIRLAYLGHDFK